MTELLVKDSFPKMNFRLVITWCFAFSVAAGNFLNISDIRLVDGSGPYGGRVEIKINGIWGTVCDDSFDFDDATVMCRMMNLKASTYMTGARYGRGKGPIFAQKFECRRYHTHLKNCTYVPNVQCTHARDIGIICSDCPQISINNGNATDISADGTVLSAMCNDGFRSNNLRSYCSNGTWSPTISCRRGYDITDIRLANGTGLYDGRVELLINGTWGTICSTEFSWSEVIAICNILFGSKFTSVQHQKYYRTSTTYGPGKGPIYLDRLSCDESATNIGECSYSLDVSCTDHTRDIAIGCYVYPLKNFTATRLVNGTGPYDGRIEVYFDGYWGTICNRYINTFDAQTICSTHKASLAMFFTESIYGKGTGPVHTGDMDCSRYTYHLKYCIIHAPYRPDCSHDYDLSIVCTSCGLPKIYNGEAVSFNYKELTVKCQEGFFPDFIKMQCLDNGTWTENQRCTYNAYPLNISEIRLKDNFRFWDSNDFSIEGRVEIFVNGTWGTVCNTDFDSKDGAVLCRMLDLEYKDEIHDYRHFFYSDFFDKEFSGPIFVDRLNCNGTEKHINNCTYEISNYCTHYDDVAVLCTGSKLNITDIRLAGTNGPYHGRVEIIVDGVWGTVCQDNLYTREAMVVCRMLGLEYNDFYHNSKYGQGSGPIYLEGLSCTSLESHISDCAYGLKYDNNCNHGKDGSVSCYGPSLRITDARLANGNGPYEGRAEIKVDSTWGTICDENFSILDADYFCKMLGLRAAKFYTGAFYGKGSGPVFIDQLLCHKNDYDLRSCKYLFLNECTHERDVSVVCKECGLPDISHWDAGFFTYNGSTLYADCSFYKTYIGTLKLTCDNDTQTWVMEGECQEYRYPLNITDIRLVGGSRPSDGRVEIKSLNTWGTICDDYFGMSEANLICKMVGYTRAVSFHTRAFYGEGKGPIFIDDFDCKDNALDFSDCTYKTFVDCSHSEDISVVCIECRDPTPEHGLIYTTSTSYQSAIRVTCEKNYELIGEENIFCQANGLWSSRPVCKPIDCGDPAPLHGSSNSSVTINGTVVLVECDKGYNITGEAIITCQPNETWTDSPYCEIIDCGVPEPENADAILLRRKTTYGETAVISCWRGYKSSGTTTVTCLSNGTWEVWAKCNLIDCGVPKPENADAMLLGNKTTYGEKAIISCWKGYRSSKTTTVSCLANGTWEVWAQCNLIDCGDPTPVHGSSSSSLTANGTVAFIECEKGYNMTGEAIITCQADETWTGNPSCEIIDCGNPIPANGYTNTTDTAYGTVVELTCKSGYSITGNSVIKCQEDGTWSDSPVCDISEKTDDDGTNKIFIIVAVCMGIVVVSIMGLVVVILRRKRDTSAKKIGESTDAAITEAETDLRYDNATQIHQTSSAREANPYESLRELRVNQSDYDMVMTPYEHCKPHDPNTLETEDKHYYQNLVITK